MSKQETRKIEVLTLEKLEAFGIFVDSTPKLREIEHNGVVIPVYIRALSGGEWADLLHDPDDQRSFPAKLISTAVFFDPEGEEAFPYVKAYQLKIKLLNKFISAVYDVSGKEVGDGG